MRETHRGVLIACAYTNNFYAAECHVRGFESRTPFDRNTLETQNPKLKKKYACTYILLKFPKRYVAGGKTNRKELQTWDLTWSPPVIVPPCMHTRVPTPHAYTLTPPVRLLSGSGAYMKSHPLSVTCAPLTTNNWQLSNLQLVKFTAQFALQQSKPPVDTSKFKLNGLNHIQILI